MLKNLTVEPAEASEFPAASLLERSVNPVYGAAGLASESKIGKIPYREDSLQACRSEAEIPFQRGCRVLWRRRIKNPAGATTRQGQKEVGIKKAWCLIPFNLRYMQILCQFSIPKHLENSLDLILH
jgi:hypothetical protein